MSAGASSQTPLGELTALPRPLAGFKGAASRQQGNRGEGRTSGRGKRERTGKGNGEERGKGGSWAIAPWLFDG